MDTCCQTCTIIMQVVVAWCPVCVLLVRYYKVPLGREVLTRYRTERRSAKLVISEQKKRNKTYTNLCQLLGIRNRTFLKVSTGNVQRRKEGKGDGYEKIENQSTENEDDTWNAKCARHCCRRKRGGD